MGFFDIFRRGKAEESLELPAEEMPDNPMDKVTVRVENLGGINDVERIERFIREGSILFLKVYDLQKKDLGQFKQSVDMLKRRCIQFGWDIVGLEEGYLVITPKFAKIER